MRKNVVYLGLKVAQVAAFYTSIVNKSDTELWKHHYYGDFNINIKRENVGSNNLSDFCDLFHLTNVVKSDTWFTKTHTSLIDLVLTKKPPSFNKIFVSESGLSDHHKAIITFFITFFKA